MGLWQKHKKTFLIITSSLPLIESILSVASFYKLAITVTCTLGGQPHAKSSIEKCSKAFISFLSIKNLTCHFTKRLVFDLYISGVVNYWLILAIISSKPLSVLYNSTVNILSLITVCVTMRF